jgi:glycosyltransferase involved in cell wall biosynthesis
MTKDDKIKISIITIVFNSENTIGRTITSVLNQSHPVDEYIIIDGNSTDKTIEIVNTFKPIFEEKKINFFVKSENDKGIYDAMNKGIEIANGNWVGIINSDDYYEINTIETIHNFIKYNNQSEVIYGNINFINRHSIIKISPKHNLRHLYNSMSIFHPSIFIQKNIYITHGLYSLEYKLSSDWELVLRLYNQNVNFQYINETLSNFTEGGAGSGFKWIHFKERLKIRHKYFRISSLIYDFKDFIILIYFKIK